MDTEITGLLKLWQAGDLHALDRLTAIVYGPLKKIAEKRLSEEHKEHSLSPTELVHEAFIALVDQQAVEWQNRKHFFAVASKIMRHILVDYARTKMAQKRGGQERTLSLEEAGEVGVTPQKMLALDEALEQLAKLDKRQMLVVELRIFGGLTVNEVAALLELSSNTIDRDWQMAKAWLYKRVWAK